MKIFADTADIAAVERLAQSGLIDGVTTNPTLIARTGRPIATVIKEIAGLVDGPVSAEVAGTEFDKMMCEADILRKLASNICVKLPLTLEGLRACQRLSSEGCETNVTLCFTANQALLAAKAGATYISSFVGRLDDIGLDGIDVLRDIRLIYGNYSGLNTQILAASLRTPNHVLAAARVGADAATMPPDVIDKLAGHPLTTSGLEMFMQDWAATGQSILPR
ncbi:fructose-6-phosphate aldolase [Roseicitreum antarcticum]|uniref:Transaldolase n=1 Tax=Roseicitreum antarcticum TaxID=564137 RepID=A0A1H3FE53_9RHOB|nr:fructose-6-phosphate aldolase [Roseicitreum antarcticum]SDX88678.1 transaldolase [Roseicitreum antarcticum]